MMNLLIFAIGILSGSAVTLIILGIQSGVGYFKVDPVEPDEGTYSVNVGLEANQNLLKKKMILLHRESQN